MDKIWLKSYRPGVPAEIDIGEYASLNDVLAQSCRKFRDLPAFRNLGATITYADLDRLSRHFAAWLQSLGLPKGTRVALMMPNLLQYPVAMFGALRAGLIVVNINPLYTARELRHQLIDSGARAIIILENFAHLLAQVRVDTPLEHIVTTGIGDLAPFAKRTVVNFLVRRIKRLVPAYELPGAVSLRHALAVGSRCEFRPSAIGPHDIAFLQYTGGTTGIAKGAMLTHLNMVANLLQVGAFRQNLIEPGQEVMITPLPLYHIFCLTCNCLLFMQHGALNVLITNPRDIPAFVSELRKWRFSMIIGVNTLYDALMHHPGFARLDFSALKLGAAGGMALHATVAEKWRAITGRPLIEGYGLTEASPVFVCNSYEAPAFGSVGLPLPSTEISIREGNVEVPAGECGELCVRGPQVMRGYWNRREDNGHGAHGRFVATHRRHCRARMRLHRRPGRALRAGGQDICRLARG